MSPGPRPLAAQEATPRLVGPAGTGAVMGVVEDRLRGESLSGLEVSVAGTDLSTRTNASGEFVLWEVPSGSHQLRVTLPPVPGLGALTLGSEVWVDAGGVAEVRFERPGPAEHRNLLCGPAGGTAAGSGAVVGRVTRRESGSPVVGAEVVFTWKGAGGGELESLLGEVVRKTENRHSVPTDTAGHFGACGVPVGREVRVGVGDASRKVTLAPDRPFVVLSIVSRKAAGLEVTGREAADATSLVGYVYAADNERPLADARVLLIDEGREATTKKGGFFRLQPVEPGRHRVVVSHLSHGTDTVEVRIEPGASTVLRLALSADPVELPELTATVERTVRQGQVRDFYERMDSGNGRFVTRDQVERNGVVNALRMLPSVRIVPGACGDCYTVQVTRGTGSLNNSCEDPAIYLDGMRLAQNQTQGAADSFELIQELPRGMIEGIEVHTPGTVPVRYGGIGSACGVILVWTRR